jgi:hypothetical protein
MAVTTPKRDPFGNVQQPSPTYPAGPHRETPFPFTQFPESEGDENIDYGKMVQDLYTPETGAQEEYSRLMGEYPERGQPGVIRRIGASLAGLGPGGYEVAHKAAYQPFYDKLEDWKQKIDPAQAAMANERASNVNLRSLANQIVSQRMSDARLERAIGRDKVLQEQGQARIEQGGERIAETQRAALEREEQGRERNKIAAARARGGEIRIDESSGQGRMFFKDGSSIDIDLKKLPQEEYMALVQEYAMARIKAGAEARAENRPKRTQLRVIEDPENPGKNILVNVDLDTDEVTPATFKREQPGGGPRVKPTLAGESEEARQITSMALEVKNSHPEWSKWIEFDNAGRFKRIKPSSLFGMVGPSDAVFKQIFRAIYGREPTQQELNPNVPPTIAQPNAQPTTGATPNPNELVDVINPQGKRVRIRKSQLADALKANPPYTQVK